MEPMNTVLLPTTVVGSYSVPEWLERLKTEYYQRRISAQHMSDIHEVAIKAAVKDQELAGIDIVSDGELRRDNDVDYFLARIPGVNIPRRAKTDYFDYYDAEVTRPLPELPEEPGAGSAGLALADDFRFTRQLTRKPIKFSFTGPFSLSRRIRDDAYLSRATGPRAHADSTPKPASWPKPGPNSSRSMSRSWPAPRIRSSWRSRR
jgi:5-methyltetrahydropteroyltriglutamate--homocysteine methyltransferase